MLHNLEALSLVQADIVGRVRFKVAGQPTLVRAGQYGRHQGAADAPALVGRIDANRRQEPVRAARVPGVQSSLFVIEIHKPPEARPAEAQRQPEHSRSYFPGEGRQSGTGRQPAASPLEPGTCQHFPVPQRVPENRSVQRGDPLLPALRLRVRVLHERVVEERPRQHVPHGAELAALHLDDFQSAELAHSGRRLPADGTAPGVVIGVPLGLA